MSSVAGDGSARNVKATLGGGAVKEASGGVKRIYPSREQPADGTEEAWGWGFADTHFRINEQGNVVMDGRRYEICGHDMPRLLPWFRKVTGVAVGEHQHQPNRAPMPQPSAAARALRQALCGLLDTSQVSCDPELLVRHGRGHTLEDIYDANYGHYGRVPDVVVFPEQETEVEALVHFAQQQGVCLIPFGGGTNVTRALACPEDEERLVISVDMRRLNRVLWIDPHELTACVQAGCVGRHLQQQLAKHGFTLGHEPDSSEFSTLGGWIATNASGMKKNRYGNIEDIVLDATIVTASGVLQRTGAMPRESVGTDVRRCFFGSEGNLGIVTSAVVKLHRLPESQRFGSVLFKSFEQGVEFLFALTRSGVVPASVRLVDNMQFQFGQALKAAPSGLKAPLANLQKWYVTSVKGFDPEQMVAATLVFEGAKTEVERQERFVYQLAKRYGGLNAGAENGRKGYQLTYAIAYLRDFCLSYYIVAESFETSVGWRSVLDVCRRAKQRAIDEHRKHNLPGKCFFSSRVTQVYASGVCVYFYFSFYHLGVKDPVGIYGEIESSIRSEILAAGGSLSHHHGVGKVRSRFLPEVMSGTSQDVLRRIKRAVDPENLFAAGNHAVTGRESVAPQPAISSSSELANRGARQSSASDGRDLLRTGTQPD